MSQYRRRRRTLAFLLGVSVFLFLGFLMLLETSNRYYNAAPPPLNYFVEEEEYSNFGYTVNTLSCKILNISAWHPSVLPFITKLNRGAEQGAENQQKCRKGRKWTYVEVGASGGYATLYLNESAIQASGYSMSAIHCCYKSFSRVTQSASSYNEAADSAVTFDSDCVPISSTKGGNRLTPKEEFIRVLCSSKFWPFASDVIYRYFHAVPIPDLESVQEKRTKLSEMKTKGMEDQPPNVILLGIDSMSRLSFERNMPLTRGLLKKMGAIEMLGYTKSGENTFPNAVQFMTGYTVEGLQQSSVCNYSDGRPIDSCPFIWKDFSSAGYLTAFIEDAPYLATYNYDKVGFLEKPVDFYLRPFMLGVNERMPRKSYYYLECLGSQTVDETVLTYMSQVLDVGKAQSVPSFIYFWGTNLAHGDMNAAQLGDSVYHDFLNTLDLQNTILFFFSDHGYRYGQIRQTFSGWYEDKLPNFWVYLPPNLRKDELQWQSSLIANSKRLLAPLDLHTTLGHILETFSQKQIRLSQEGRSLFKAISSERRCQDAGIAENFCACTIPRKLPVSDERLFQAAKTAVKTLNSHLPANCASLSVEFINAGGIINANGTTTIIVAFFTRPGGFLFEGNVLLREEKFSLMGELLRMNKISTDVSCVKGDLQKFCLCANQ